MSYTAYPVYKPSGVEWLGDVPEHWGIVRLKYLCDIETGTHDTENADEDGLYPFFVRSQTVEHAALFTHNTEAILTAGDGAVVGKVFHHYSGPFLAHQRVYFLLNFKFVSARFLFHYVKALFAKVALDGGAKSTVDSLRRPVFQQFLCCVPSLSEQTAIAAYLDQHTQQIDRLIQRQQRLIELLQEKRQAVITHAVTRGLNPDAPLKHSGVEWLGEVPEHWESIRLRYVATLNPSKQELKCWPSQTPVSFLPMEAIGDDNTIDTSRTATIEDKQQGFTFFRDGDCCLAKITPCFENGKGAILRGMTNSIGFGTTELIVFRPRSSVTVSFLFALVHSHSIRNLGEGWMYGAGGQKRVPEDFFRNLKITLPPLPEQIAIAAYLDTETQQIDNVVSHAQRSITLLQERRSALISAAVTGKIDVRAAV